jgi:hypothetical protein
MTLIKFTSSEGTEIVAQYNPNTITQGISADFSVDGAKRTAEAIKWNKSGFMTWGFTLIYEDSESETATIVSNVTALKTLLMTPLDSLHEPDGVTVSFGSISFIGYCKSFDLQYTGFDLDGAPLTAEVKLSFHEIWPEGSDPQSPDITHLITFNEGDYLSKISNEIYGSTNYMTQLARANNLDSFRGIEPGKKIYVPPLQ